MPVVPVSCRAASVGSLSFQGVMRFLRSLHRQVRELPSLHQVMFWFACGAVVWQSVYLIDFTVLYLDRAWGIGVGLGHGNQPWSLLMLLDPVLFLTLCSAFYVGSIVVIGRAYVLRKEAALVVALEEAKHKNTYLEHAAKILRHDMHSGINTYIPRGIRSLERRLEKSPDVVEALRLEAPLRLLKEGLAHTQKVYAGVTEFTNLVKAGASIEKVPHDLREILVSYLDTTSYKSEVVIDALPTVGVNGPLFCTALDNLIRNGLKYNDSPSKMVIVTMMDDDHLGILDNGRGMTQAAFIEYSKPYTRKSDQQEKGTGLGLNICIAILHEHGFPVTCSIRDEGGTLIKVKIQ